MTPIFFLKAESSFSLRVDGWTVMTETAPSIGARKPSSSLAIASLSISLDVTIPAVAPFSMEKSSTESIPPETTLEKSTMDCPVSEYECERNKHIKNEHNNKTVNDRLCSGLRDLGYAVPDSQPCIATQSCYHKSEKQAF